ncbi:hypothetical protein [Bradyrhizobium sp. McL0616]|uniref:hypothetical protein n=1 Tax=Bradyrhizobium sp. McL0616 TaxID=3415674 RepID=UPI003CE92D92
MTKRHRFKQKISLKDRLVAFANGVREKASALPPGPGRDEMLRKARQAETASHLDDWANSTELKPPP